MIMNIEKAVWVSSGNSMHLSVPITKVNVEKRTVSGYASLDNIDQHGDVVTAEASREAFARFRGNLREMHQHVAVGKVLDVQEKKYYDADSDNWYQGIYVTARVSKGAQNTWEKVLDETLSGFSIGGDVEEDEDVFDKEANKPIRHIKKYVLHELSLVDNPANQFANVVSFEKLADGHVVAKGMVAESNTENVFYCKSDKIAEAAGTDSKDCEVCDDTMEKIGWFEYTDASDKENAVANYVKKFLENDKGGVQMPEEVKAPEDKVVSEQVVEVEEAKTLPVEETTTVEVKEVEEPDFASLLQDTREHADNLQASLEKLGEEHVSTISTVKSIGESVETLIKSVSEKFSTFDKKFDDLQGAQKEVTEKFASLSDDLRKVNDEVKTVQDSTAVKKSSDLGGSGKEAIRKREGGVWNGTFLDVNDI